jgi:hypothetical protein
MVMHMAIDGSAGQYYVGVVSTTATGVPLSNESTLHAWQSAVQNGHLYQAAALRHVLVSLEDEPTTADAEWR